MRTVLLEPCEEALSSYPTFLEYRAELATAMERFRTLVDLAFTALPVRLAQFGLQDLSRRVPRDGIDALDSRWALEAGQTLTAVCDDLFLTGVMAFGSDNDRQGRLTPALAGYADDSGVGNSVVGHQGVPLLLAASPWQ